MATKINIKTTFEPAKTLEPIYTGGEVALGGSERWLATCVEEDVLVVEAGTGETLVRIDGDGEPVTTLYLSPSGSHLVVCSRSTSMRIYGLNYSDSPKSIFAELQKTLKPHPSPVVTSTGDETGTLLATGGADGTVKIWDIKGGFVTHTFHGQSSLISALCFFKIKRDFKQNGSTDAQRRSKQRDTNDDKMQPANPAMQNFICLAAAGEDGKVRVWDLSSRKIVATLESHVSVVRSLDYSPAEETLLSASRDKTITLWDSKTWEIRRVLPTLEVIESAGFVLDGKYCYTGGENGVVRIWTTSTGREITKKQQSGIENDAIVSVCSIPSRSALLSVHQDQMIRIHSLEILKSANSETSIESLTVTHRISGNHDEIIDMACVGPRRSLLALATNTESIRLISIKDAETSKRKSGSGTKNLGPFGSDVALLEGHQDIILCLDVDWSGHWLATGAKDNSARLWRLDPSSSSYSCFAVLVGHAESLGAIALPRSHPTSNAALKDSVNTPPEFLLTGSQDRTVKRWDTSKLLYSPASTQPLTHAKAVFTRVAHEKDINALDVSPVAPLFASASQDRTIKIWSIEDGSVVGILRGHKRGVWSIRFSPAAAPALNLADGGTSGSRGLLVSGSGDRTVKVWSMSTYTCLLTFEGHSNTVLKVIWLPPPPPLSKEDPQNTQGQQSHQTQPIIASASSDTLIKLWSPYADPTSDHLLTTLDNHNDRVWALTTPFPSPLFSTYPLISGAADARLTFWTDSTSTTLSAQLAASSARIEQDQSLQNHIFSRNYREAITLALTLNHPGRLLKLFEDVTHLPGSEKDADSITGKTAVDEVIANLSRDQLYLLLCRVRDWNTNARTSPVAQRVLNVVLKSYGRDVFVRMAKDRGLGARSEAQAALPDAGHHAQTSWKQSKMAMRDLLRALEVYSEKHYKRMEELVDESWVLEYTLREMDDVSGGVGVGVSAAALEEDRGQGSGSDKLIIGKLLRSAQQVGVEGDVVML